MKVLFPDILAPKVCPGVPVAYNFTGPEIHQQRSWEGV
jgi:hypothetical protein